MTPQRQMALWQGQLGKDAASVGQRGRSMRGEWACDLQLLGLPRSSRHVQVWERMGCVTRTVTLSLGVEQREPRKSPALSSALSPHDGPLRRVLLSPAEELKARSGQPGNPLPPQRGPPAQPVTLACHTSPWVLGPGGAGTNPMDGAEMTNSERPRE